MKAIISHYKIHLFRLKDDVYINLQTLSEQVHSERFTLLTNTLKSYQKKLTRKLTFTQEKKFTKLTKIKQRSNSSQLLGSDWIPEFSLTTTKRDFILNNEYLCDCIIDSALSLIQTKKPHFTFQSTCFDYTLLQYNPLKKIHVHHNGQFHFVTSCSIGGKVKLFDSLNLQPSEELIKQINILYSPDPTVSSTINQAQLRELQRGSKDCGLFAIAFATELAFGHDPSNFIFDQSKMRQHLIKCFESRSISRFPKVRLLHTQPTYNEINSQLSSTSRWITPIKTMKKINHTPKIIPLSNRFHMLEGLSQFPNTDDLVTKITNSVDISKHIINNSNNKEHLFTHKNKITTNSGSQQKIVKTVKTSSLIINLSKRILSETERNVLELGLTFCPSQKNYNKEQISLDFFQFIHRLRLREYFFINKETTSNQSDNTIDERYNSKWKEKNSEWYPDYVKYNCSEGLEMLISNVTKDINSLLKDKERKFWNNLTASQREAILDLSKDDSIIIKPADKGGVLVIMDSVDYKKGCLQILSDKEFRKKFLKTQTLPMKKKLMLKLILCYPLTSSLNLKPLI